MMKNFTLLVLACATLLALGLPNSRADDPTVEAVDVEPPTYTTRTSSTTSSSTTSHATTSLSTTSQTTTSPSTTSQTTTSPLTSSSSTTATSTTSESTSTTSTTATTSSATAAEKEAVTTVSEKSSTTPPTTTSTTAAAATTTTTTAKTPVETTATTKETPTTAKESPTTEATAAKSVKSTTTSKPELPSNPGKNETRPDKTEYIIKIDGAGKEESETIVPSTEENIPHAPTKKAHEESRNDTVEIEEYSMETRCLDDQEDCTQERMSEFIATWLTHDGIPGMVFLIGNSISLVGLLSTFVTFCLFRILRNSPRGISTIHLVAALFLAKLAFQVNPHFAPFPVACSILAMGQHYFCLAAFLWMNVVAYDVMMEAWDIRFQEASDDVKCRTKRSTLWYALFAWGIPGVIVGTCALIQILASESGFMFPYGNREQCGVFGSESLLYTLAFPLAIISLLNMFFFIFTVKWLPASILFCRRSSVKKNPDSLPEDDVIPPPPAVEVIATGRNMAHRHVWAYVRMSVVMSIAWLSGFISVFTQTYWLWVVFVLMNSLQGTLIFISLVLNGHVLSLYLEHFRLRPLLLTSRCRASCGEKMSNEEPFTIGQYPCTLPVISDGYVLLDDKTDIVFIK